MPPVPVNPIDPTQQHGGKPPRQDDLSNIIRTLQERITALEQNLQGENFIPVGVMSSYGGGSDPVDPDGSVTWMICNGRALSRSAYPTLFANIGTTYGSGNGTTTFNIPDMRGRMPLGSSASGPAIGQSGGQLGHTHSVPTQSVPAHYHGSGSLATNSSGSHTHSMIDGLGNQMYVPYSIYAASNGGFSIGAANSGPFPVIAYPSAAINTFAAFTSVPAAGTHSHGVTGLAGNTGGPSGDSAMNTNSSSSNTGSNDPPYLTVTYVIKVI